MVRLLSENKIKPISILLWSWKERDAVSQNPVLFEDELRNILPSGQKETNLQLKRILNSPNSEDFLTWSIFRPLMDVKPLSKWLVPFFQKSLKSSGGL